MAELQKQALELRPEFRALRESNVEAQKPGGAVRLAAVGARACPASHASRPATTEGFSGKQYSVAAGHPGRLGFSTMVALRDASRDTRLESLPPSVFELQLAQLHDTINDDIAQADRALRTKRQALQTAQKSVSLSTETLALIRAQHDAGTATQLDLLQSQDALVTAEVGLAQARFDLATSQIQLDRLSGSFAGGAAK